VIIADDRSGRRQEDTLQRGFTSRQRKAALKRVLLTPVARVQNYMTIELLTISICGGGIAGKCVEVFFACCRSVSR
jgi:hypothetical protein